MIYLCMNNKPTLTFQFLKHLQDDVIKSKKLFSNDEIKKIKILSLLLPIVALSFKICVV